MSDEINESRNLPEPEEDPNAESGGSEPQYANRLAKIARSRVTFWIGLMIGVLVAFVILQFIMPATAKNWGSFLYGALGAFTVITLILGGAYLFLRKRIKRQVNQIGSKGKELLDSIGKILMAKDLVEARQKFQESLPELSAQIKLILLKRWTLNAFRVVGVFFIGLFSSILVFQGNELMDFQNKLVERQVNLEDRQVLLSEVERRKSDEEVSAIIDQTVAYFLSNPDSHAIPAPIKSRIASSTNQFIPYELPAREGGYRDSTKVYLSPERGRLFAWLVEFNPTNLSDVLTISDFSYADLEGRIISINRPVESLRLENANLKGCTLRNIDWPRARMKGADLTGATLDNVSLYHADLRNVKMDTVLIIKTLDLTSADCEGLSMQNVKYSSQKDGNPLFNDNGELSAAIVIESSDTAQFKQSNVDEMVVKFLLHIVK